MKLITVDYDPFAEAPATSAGGLVPVEYDPFAEPENINQALAEAPPVRTSIALGGANVPEDQPLPNTGPVDRALTAIGDVPEAAMRGYYNAKIGANLLAADRGIISPELAAKNIAENVKKTREVPMPETVQKGMEEFEKAEGWQAKFDVLKQYPDILPSVVGESTASQLLSAGTGATGALIGSAAGPVGITAGLAGGIGIGSTFTEYASTLNNFLTEKGYDTANPEQLREAFSNPELMSEARTYAVKRGVAVGAFDALTAGFAGKLFGPVSRMFGKTPVGQTVGRTAGATAEVGSQMAGGAGGAATGQVLTEGKVTDPGEVILEAAGELVPGLGEIAIGSMAQPKAAPAAPSSAGEAIIPPQAPEGPLQVLVQAPPPNAPAKEDVSEAAPAAPEEPAPEPVDLEEAAILKADGVSPRTIAAMSAAQRSARAREAVEQRGVTPAKLTEKDKALLEAPAAPPSPVPAVEARGPEAVIPSPSAPPAAPSEIATGLVQQGVPPLEAMRQAVEQRQAAEAAVPAPAPVVEPQPAITPVTEPEPVAEAPKAEAKPIPFSAPEAKKAIDTAATGKPFKATLIRGQGATESPYNQFGAKEPILGEGRYTTYDKEFASIFGPNVTEHDVSLQNPLVISNNAQWRALTKSAGWEFPNPFGTKIERVSQNIKNLRKMLVDQGYDGVVVRIPENEVDTAIAKVFGADQVVEFNAQKPAIAEKPAAKAEPVKVEAPKKGAPRPFWRAGNMDTVIRNMGGIKDVGGELKSRDVPRQLINNKRGRPLEEVALDLIERGYYPEFKVQLDNVRENSPDSYQPTPEMIEQIKNDIGKKKMHPSYQEDIEEARRLDEEKNVFGPYVEDAEKAAAELGIGKNDPMVRQAAQMVYDGQFDNPEDAFRALLFTEIEDALPLEDLPELRAAFGEENLKDIEEFLAIEGMAPLEADYVPEPQPVSEGVSVGGESREQGAEPEGEGAPEIISSKMEKLVVSPAKEEVGAEGKPQLVIPGAERVTTKEQLERKAAAPLKAKAKQKAPGGLFSDERFQQDLFSSVESKPEPKVVTEQKVKEFPKEQWLIDIAKSRGLRPIFSDNKIGLILSYSTGNPIYYGVHRSKNKITGDISEYIGSVFTNEELATLNKIRKEDLKNNMEAFNANPDGPFANGDIVISQNFPKDYGKIAEEWVKLANMPKGTRILFTTVEDAENMNLAHDYRYIHQARKELGGANGVRMGLLKNKEVLWHAIVLKPNMPKAKTLESLSHEIGHVMEDEILAKASLEEREAIKKAYLDWKARSKDKTVADMISNRAFKSYMAIVKSHPNMMGLPPKGNIAPDQISYFFSFPEWFADQTARYFNSQEKALTTVDKFFKRLADALRRFYASIRGEKFLPDPVFKEWLDNHIASNKATITNLQNEFVDRAISQRQQDVFENEPTLEYEAPRNSFGSQLMFNYVDRFYDATAIKRAIEAARGAPLEESLDIEMALQLMPDKAIAKQNKIWEDEVTPALAAMKANGVTADEMGKFMYALHAPERNARMAQRDPTRFTGDNGSGMTNQEAKDYMDGLSDNQKKVMLGIYKDHIKKMLMEDLKYRYDKGLIPKSEYDMLTLPKEKGGYEYYVPLSGYAEDEADATTQHPNIGRGFAVWGKEYKLAAGRKSRAFNPLFSAIQKRMDGIVRVEKNDTSLTLYNLLDNYPNPEIAEIYTNKELPKRPVLRADGTIQYISDFQMARAENTLPLKIGGLQHFIVFNQENESAIRLVRILKNMTRDEADISMRMILAMGRFMSKINTQWVPDFFLTNFPRDIQDALVSVYETKEGFATNFVKELYSAAKVVKDRVAGKPLSPRDQILYDEWVGHGGSMDFDGFLTIPKAQQRLERDFGELWKDEKTTVEKLDRVIRRAGEMTLGVIENVNQVFDDTVRFAVYRAARKDEKNRFSPDRAAQLARRATVDFRQRGQRMAFLNAMKPYLAVGITSARRLAQLLTSKRGLQVLAAYQMVGVMNAIVGTMFSDDDDTDPTKKKFYTQIEDWDRAKSFIVPIPINGQYYKIPLGFFGVASFGLGDQLIGVLTGNVKPGQAATNVGSSVLASFVPVWSGGVVDAVTPWVLQPFIELWTNKNWLGNPINPDKDTSMPQSSQAFEGTPKWAKSVAEFMNQWGGSYTEPGWVDVYPGTLSYMANFVTQSAGTFVSSTFDPFRKLANGESIDPSKLPFLRRAMTRDTTARTDYYEIRNKIKADVALARESRKIIADPKMDAEKKRDARATLVRLKREIGISETTDGISQKNSVAEQFDDVDKRLKLLNTQIKQIQSSKELTTAQKREAIQTREETKKRIMDNARKAYIRRMKNIQSRD